MNMFDTIRLFIISLFYYIFDRRAAVRPIAGTSNPPLNLTSSHVVSDIEMQYLPEAIGETEFDEVPDDVDEFDEFNQVPNEVDDFIATPGGKSIAFLHISVLRYST